MYSQQSHWSLPLLGNTPKKFDFVHQIVSRQEVCVGWGRDQWVSALVVNLVYGGKWMSCTYQDGWVVKALDSTVSRTPTYPLPVKFTALCQSSWTTELFLVLDSSNLAPMLLLSVSPHHLPAVQVLSFVLWVERLASPWGGCVRSWVCLLRVEVDLGAVLESELVQKWRYGR